ncbi:MAG: membrane protein insertase YidC, partial [Ginsengibacter sp.]
MDRNTVIGFVLLALLFFGYFYYNKQGQVALEKERQHIQDSINRLKPKVDTSANTALVTNNNSSSKKDSALLDIEQDTAGKEQFIILENKVLKITFTNKGGQPKKVELKNFKTFDNKPLILQDGNFSNISYSINTGVNQTAQTSDLLFTPSNVQTSNDGQKTISYTLQTKDGKKIEHQFVLQPDDYMIGFNIKFEGANSLVTQNTINLTWLAKASKQEKDIEWETQQSHVAYVESGDYDFDHLSVGKSDDKRLDKPVDWIALKQQFFASSIV